jgi:hypothetical protein
VAALEKEARNMKSLCWRMAGVATLAVVGLGAGLSPRAASDTEVARVGMGIADVAFMAGQWRSEGEGGVTEEHWSKPAGNNVMGMFRWLQPSGKPAMFEILTITEEPEGVFLRLRHFSPKLSAKEDKDAPMTLKLSEATADKAVFKAVESEKSLAAVTYHRKSPDLLHILVEFPDPTREPLTFDLKRTTVDGK